MAQKLTLLKQIQTIKTIQTMSYEQVLKLNKMIDELRKSIESSKQEKLELQQQNQQLRDAVNELTKKISILHSFLEVAQQEKNICETFKKRAEDAEERVRVMETNQKQLKTILEKSIDELQQIIREVL